MSKQRSLFSPAEKGVEFSFVNIGATLLIPLDQDLNGLIFGRRSSFGSKEIFDELRRDRREGGGGVVFSQVKKKFSIT